MLPRKYFSLGRPFNPKEKKIAFNQTLALITSYIVFILPGGPKIYQVHVRRLLLNAGNQWPYAVCAFFTCAGAGFGAFLLVQRLHMVHRMKVVNQAEREGLNASEFPHPWMAVLLALEFTFVNSFLEEFFWRVYLYREFGGGNGTAALALGGFSASSPLSPVTVADGSLAQQRADEATPLQEPAQELKAAEEGARQAALGGNVHLCCLPLAETPKVLLSAYYAAYHVVVMACFVEWYLCVAGFCGLVVLGRSFILCRESEVASCPSCASLSCAFSLYAPLTPRPLPCRCQAFGVVAGWGVHAGVDAAFCLVMAQLYFRFVR